ncbi:MAG: hypothetical protein QM736_21400 [Vicinamibacterales bacterium]
MLLPRRSRATTSSGRTDVLNDFPLIGSSGQSLFEQRHREVRPSGSARVRLREKNRAEPVSDIEIGIQRRRRIQERIQEREVGPRHRVGSAGFTRLVQLKLDSAADRIARIQ